MPEELEKLMTDLSKNSGYSKVDNEIDQADEKKVEVKLYDHKDFAMTF